MGFAANIVSLLVHRRAVDIKVVEIDDFDVRLRIVTCVKRQAEFIEWGFKSITSPFFPVVFYFMVKKVRIKVIGVCVKAPVPSGESTCCISALSDSTMRHVLTRVIPWALCSWADWLVEFGSVEVAGMHRCDQVLAFALEVLPTLIVEKVVWEVFIA